MEISLENNYPQNFLIARLQTEDTLKNVRK